MNSRIARESHRGPCYIRDTKSSINGLAINSSIHGCCKLWALHSAERTHGVQAPFWYALKGLEGPKAPNMAMPVQPKYLPSTWRLLRVSILGSILYFLKRKQVITKKEPHRSLWVHTWTLLDSWNDKGQFIWWSVPTGSTTEPQREIKKRVPDRHPDAVVFWIGYIGRYLWP